MKKRLFAVAMILVFAFGITGCSSLSPKKAEELVQAELDSQLKRQHDALAKFTKKSVEDIELQNDENIQELVDALKESLGMEVPDELIEKMKSCILTVSTYTEYSIVSSEKSDDGFIVTVTYKTLDNFSKVEDMFTEKLQELDQEALATMTEDGLTTMIYGLLGEVFDGIAAEPMYGEERTATVGVAVEDKLLTCNFSDLESLVMDMLGSM